MFASPSRFRAACPDCIRCIIICLAVVSICFSRSEQARADGSAAAPTVTHIPSGQTILVQPGVSYSNTGGDDLNTIREYYRGASWENHVDEHTWGYLKRLGVDRFRLINVERDDWGPADAAPEKQHLLPSKRLERALNDCRAYHVKPHIIVGQSCITALAYHPKDGKPYGVADWKRYEQYAYAFIKYVVIDQGFTHADFEVGNEIDTGGQAWLTGDRHKLSFGSLPLYQLYLRLYSAWADAVQRLSSEHPDLKLRIGGPAMTGYTTGLGEFNWATRLIRDCSTQNIRLDFVSFHGYGNGVPLDGHRRLGPQPPLGEQISTIRRALRQAGKTGTPIYMTEWGPSWVTKETPAGIINGNHVGAAWTAAFFMDMIANNVDEALALVFRDHNHWREGKPKEDNWGWPGYLTLGGKHPKALYNVFLMFQMLPGHRVECSRGQGSVSVFAAGDDKAVGVIASNWDWDFAHHTEHAQPQTVHLRVKGLAFKSPQVEVRVYRIDKDHSDAYQDFKAGKPITDDHAKLQMIHSYRAAVADDTVDLPNSTLPPSSVTLWMIRSASTAAKTDHKRD